MKRIELSLLDLLFGGIAVVVVAIMATVYLFFIGFILSLLWGWFVAPLGIPTISAAQGGGLYVLVRLFLGFREAEDQSPWVLYILFPALVLALGFIMYLFV